MPSVLIVGATRGLGAALLSQYASQPSTTVYATTRSHHAPSEPTPSENVHWLTGIELTSPDVGHKIVQALTASPLKASGISHVYITAGYFATEDFTSTSTDSGPNWEAEVKMYTTSAIAPVFIVHALQHVPRLLALEEAKIVLVSSESGSITLRHEQEGGGNFGHHGSKAALNMVGKQLALDLKDSGTAVAIVHPSFMRTDMTRGVGFDKFYDDGGALEPDVAAEILTNWVDGTFNIKMTGQYWAPRGKRDIGNWDVVMGEETGEEGPVQLPW